MVESLKNRIILILIISNVIFFISSISSCGNASRMKTVRDKEMLLRLDLDERISKLTQEKQLSEVKLGNANKELTAEKAAHEAIKKELLEEQLVNNSLKDELGKVTKLNETLEEDLKEALAKSKTKPKKTISH